MKKNQFAYLLLNLLCITPSLSFAMHQLARPILTQASAQIATISPQLINMIRKSSQATAQEKNTSSADNNINTTPKVEKLSEQDLRKLLEELIKEQKEQSAALKELQNSKFGFFGYWLLLTTYCMTIQIVSKINNNDRDNSNKFFNISSKEAIIQQKLEHIEKNIKEIQKKYA